METPKISDEDTRRIWLIGSPKRPRLGLLTSEFADVLDVGPSAIRAAITRGKLPGVRLKMRGLVYAYAATVEDVANYYDLPDEAVEHLRRLTQKDASGRIAWIGTRFFSTDGSDELKTEFNNREEFDDANRKESDDPK